MTIKNINIIINYLMKFLSYNIQYGRDQKGKHNLYRVAEAIKETDVACIQEIEKFWQRSGFVDQAQILSEFLPKFYSVYGPALDMDASLKKRIWTNFKST